MDRLVLDPLSLTHFFSPAFHIASLLLNTFIVKCHIIFVEHVLVLCARHDSNPVTWQWEFL